MMDHILVWSDVGEMGWLFWVATPALLYCEQFVFILFTVIYVTHWHGGVGREGEEV